MDIQVHIEEDYAGLSHRAAEVVMDFIRTHPDALVCPASGSTPIDTYRHLAAHKEEVPEFGRQIRVVKLDEWLGLPMDDSASCEKYLQDRLIKPLEVSPDRYLGFDSDPEDAEEECERIRSELHRWGRIDLGILGVGTNGHLGFNEPGGFLLPDPHVARLTEETRSHPMVAKSGYELSRGLTLGLRDILSAGTLLLLVSGSHKHPVMERFATGWITTRLPVSLLLTHSNLHCICDREAVVGVEAQLRS